MDINRLAATYDHIAKDWAATHRNDTWWMEGYGKFVSLLPSGASVFDAGCGPGYKSKFLTESGFDVTGIDISREMIALAERNCPEGDFQIGNFAGRFFPWGPVFDGVFAEASLLHVSRDHIDIAMRNLVGVLADGGHLYASVKAPKRSGPREEIKRESDLGYDYERFFAYYTLDEICAHMRKRDLTVVYEHVTHSGDTDWIQVIARK